MDFKITPNAKLDLNRLAAGERTSVISSIRQNLPTTLAADPVVKIPRAGDMPVHIHQVGDNVVLYRVAEGDVAGDRDIVVISILNQRDLPQANHAGSIVTAIADTIG